MFAFHTETYKWEKIEPVEGEFPYRKLHTAVLVGDKLIIIGGAGAKGYAGNVVLVFDLVLYTVEEMHLHEQTLPPLIAHTSEYAARSRSVLVFTNAHPSLNLVYAYNLSLNHWKQVDTKGKAPARRMRPGSALLGSNWYIYGGELLPGLGFANDLHVLEMNTNAFVWSEVKVDSTVRVAAPMLMIQGKLLVFSYGYASTPCLCEPELGRVTNFRRREIDRHQDDGDELPKCTINFPWPPPRSNCMAVVNQHKVFVFGGSQVMASDVMVLQAEPLP